MTKIRHLKFRKFAGPSIRGTAKQNLASMDWPHFDRALWLTSEVESGGRYGAVTMYDGTGVTAGLHQAIAVYPRNLKEQGLFFKLLHRIDAYVPTTYFSLGSLMRGQQWSIAGDGKLRHAGSGATVSPKTFRNIVTPQNGVVPARGASWEQSKRWALAFHEIFADPDSFRAQGEFGREHFVKRCKRLKHPKLDRHTIEDLVYDGECLKANVFSDYPWTDLAMATFWSHSVNGPSPALTRLARALKACPDVKDPRFAKVLLRQLANATYGRWVDDLKSGRWARTRREAMKVWPLWLFKRRQGEGNPVVMARYM